MTLIELQEKMKDRKFYYFGLTQEQADSYQHSEKSLIYSPDGVIGIGVDEEVEDLAEYLVTSKF